MVLGLQVVILAVFVESVVQAVAWAIENGFNWKRTLALVLGPVVAILAGVDVFKEVGIPLALPYIGSLLTGIMLCRGATVAHDLFVTIQTFGSKFNSKGEDGSGA